MNRCRQRNIKVNQAEVALKTPSVPYIGHILTADRVNADATKISSIKEMKNPTDNSGVRRLLGTANYLSKFLPKLSDLAESLRQLTRDEVDFKWTKTHEDAFLRIKEMVTSPPILKYYDPQKDLVLQCDASETGLGSTLMPAERLPQLKETTPISKRISWP